MASINSTQSVTTGSMMPGLVSGLDTESMVEKLLSGTQSKIDAQNAKKQQIEWKQEIYRDIIGKLDNFRTNFFTYSSSRDTNLLSNAFYNTMSTTSSSSAVKVISSSSLASANIKIDSIKQLATAYSMSTSANVRVSKALEGTVTAENLESLKGQELSLDISLDGVKKTVKFQGADTVQGIADNLNKSLKNVFGDIVEAAVSGDELKIDGKDNSHMIVLTETQNGDTLKKLGFSEGASNKLNYNTLLKDSPFAIPLQGNEFEFSINGTAIKVTGSNTVGDLISRINNSDAGVRVTYNAITDKFTMESKITGDIHGIDLEQTQGNLLSAMFGEEGLSFDISDPALQITKGQNAVLVVDGMTIERNSNEFEMEGITIQIQAVSEGPINLTTERDTDRIVYRIKEFVEEYNKIIDELNGYLTENSSYRSYAPLTEAQKKEMTEKEIELWETKAKEGLLRNDSNISTLLSRMRLAMYKTVESAGIAIYDIGLDTSPNYKDNGKLTLDEDKLRSMLSTDLEKVQKLFSDKEDGIGQTLSNILKENANISSGSPGIMVTYAGVKTVLDTQNVLSKQLKEISSRITELSSRYETERTRYWNMFSQMEQALSQLNTQSSWLSQQFSS